MFVKDGVMNERSRKISVMSWRCGEFGIQQVKQSARVVVFAKVTTTSYFKTLSVGLVGVELTMLNQLSHRCMVHNLFALCKNFTAAQVVGRVHSSTHGEDEEILCSVGANRLVRRRRLNK
ncbi:uncharacterized protein LOC141885408 [Acropora palmata]|uniref:uncharacterized protein LOC141885408 n=1 Tax=Acropora palmata TaxID=6131 RepID=UPI003D9FCA67